MYTNIFVTAWLCASAGVIISTPINDAPINDEKSQILSTLDDINKDVEDMLDSQTDQGSDDWLNPEVSNFDSSLFLENEEVNLDSLLQHTENPRFRSDDTWNYIEDADITTTQSTVDQNNQSSTLSVTSPTVETATSFSTDSLSTDAASTPNPGLTSASTDSLSTTNGEVTSASTASLSTTNGEVTSASTDSLSTTNGEVTSASTDSLSTTNGEVTSASTDSLSTTNGDVTSAPTDAVSTTNAGLASPSRDSVSTPNPEVTSSPLTTHVTKNGPMLIGSCSNWGRYNTTCKYKNLVRNSCRNQPTCRIFIKTFIQECLISNFFQLTCPSTCRACKTGPYLVALPFNGNLPCNSKNSLIQSDVNFKELGICEGKQKITLCLSFLHRWGFRYRSQLRTSVRTCVRGPELPRKREVCKKLKNQNLKLQKKMGNFQRASFDFQVPCGKYEVTIHVRRGGQGIDVDEASLHVGKCRKIEFQDHTMSNFRYEPDLMEKDENEDSSSFN